MPADPGGGGRAAKADVTLSTSASASASLRRISPAPWERRGGAVQSSENVCTNKSRAMNGSETAAASERATSNGLSLRGISTFWYVPRVFVPNYCR